MSTAPATRATRSETTDRSAPMIMSVRVPFKSCATSAVTADEGSDAVSIVRSSICLSQRRAVALPNADTYLPLRTLKWCTAVMPAAATSCQLRSSQHLPSRQFFAPHASAVGNLASDMRCKMTTLKRVGAVRKLMFSIS
eukprot:4490623-Pleurochrysis_carterae.AAC.2